MVVRSRALLMTIQFANLTTAKFRRPNWGPHVEGRRLSSGLVQ